MIANDFDVNERHKWTNLLSYKKVGYECFIRIILLNDIPF